jgi:hypothetical protein
MQFSRCTLRPFLGERMAPLRYMAHPLVREPFHDFVSAWQYRSFLTPPKTVIFPHLRSQFSQPNLAASPSSSHTVGASFLFTRSSLIILESFLMSSPSTSRRACGSLASNKKWLSQCGQYSSLSSNDSMSLRKHFLHFLHAKIISTAPWSSWSCFSPWHSAQSNHCRQHGERIETWALRMCLLDNLLASRCM